LELNGQLVYPGEEPPGMHCVEDRVGPIAGADDLEKRKLATLRELELLPLGHPVNSLPTSHNNSNWFFMMPSIATKFQYVNSLLFPFSLTTRFGPYSPSSGEIYNYIF
jgi:hypothetical protein